MTVSLYNTSDPNNKLNKSLSAVQESISAVPTQGVSLLAPSLILDYVEAYLGANYIYISEFGRYYYITDMKVDIGKKIYIYCSVDPLMSFSAEILSCPVVITRNEGIGRPTMIPDSMLPVNPSAKRTTSIKMSDTSASLDVNGTTCYLLTTIG